MDENNTNNQVNPTQVSDDDLKDLTGEELVELYAAQLLSDKGIEDKDGAQAKELKQELINKINEEILDALSDEKFEELKNTMDEGGDLDAVIESAGIDTAEIAQKAMQDFRAAYLGEA